MLEGRRTVSEALAAGIEPSVVAVPESAADDAAGRDVLARVGTRTEVVVLSDRAFGSVAPATSPQPMLALIDKPRACLPESLADDDLVIVLVGVSDPGNTGTIIRTRPRPARPDAWW